MNAISTINILLADDDKDDCLLFQEAIEDLKLPAQLVTLHDGEQLIMYLESVSPILPDLIFLDLNMPRKNGFECLTEIKTHAELHSIPVIIYSTFFDKEKAFLLKQAGARYYICKPANFNDLKTVIGRAIMLVKENNSQVFADNFLINKFCTAL